MIFFFTVKSFMKKVLQVAVFTVLFSVFAMLPVQAQWLTQSLSLKPGWNGVFLHVDASHDNIANLVGQDAANPIAEIWMWAPAPLSQSVNFLGTPSESSQWIGWKRETQSSSQLQRLAGNVAYLVRVGTNVSTYTWQIKGKPVAPA